MNSPLSGKVAVITGAAGGLGRALSRAFSEAGASLVLLDRNAARLAEAAAALPAPPRTAVVDIAHRAAVREAIADAAAPAGRIDILINNAAICRTKPFLELDEQDWDEMLDINVKGLFFALQAAVPHMPAGSSILNIASVAGRVGRPTLLHYAASKAAVISITRSAAAGLAPQGIRVNAIAPGMIDTEMLHQLRQSWQTQGAGAPPDTAQPALSSTLLGRPADPAEIASTALYLSSPAASYITGQTLNVCGGIVMS